MKPHKWAKEIKAWADGAEIQGMFKDSKAGWFDCAEIDWNDEYYEYRIKPQQQQCSCCGQHIKDVPKEPQYLYAWENQSTGEFRLGENEPNPLREYVSQWKCIGKIKLETEDE